MNEFTGYIYSITNMLNGHKYIGKTNDVERRWREHRYGNGGTSILNKAFKKYGIDNFLFEIIAQIPFNNTDELNDVLNQLEVYYISLYNTLKEGYNATAGGEGISFYHHSEETKQKISRGQIGKILSEEHKEKCRIANLGNHHTEDAKYKITQALLNRDHAIYEKMADKLRGKTRNHEMIMKAAEKRRKPVLQYDMQGNFIQEFEAASQAGFGRGTNITACCKGKILSACGFIWRYKESENYPHTIEVPERWVDSKKKVGQYDKNSILIAEYSSISEASRATGISTGNIYQCLKGKYKQTKGFIWKYMEGKEVNHA